MFVRVDIENLCCAVFVQLLSLSSSISKILQYKNSQLHVCFTAFRGCHVKCKV